MTKLLLGKPKELCLLAVAVVLLSMGAFFWRGSSDHNPEIKLRLTAGDASGLRHRLATEFSQEAANSGIRILVEPTNGSEAAVFTVSTLPSPIADFLTDEHGYRLIPLKFGDAISLEAFLELGTSPPTGSVDKQHIYSTIIPAFTYSVDPASPPEPLATIGTRLLLVAHERVRGDHVKRLLECLYRSSLMKAERPSIDSNILELPTEFPIQARRPTRNELGLQMD